MRIESLFVASVKGTGDEGVELARCHSTWLHFKSKKRRPDVSVSRNLCKSESGDFAWYSRFGLNTDGSVAELLVDVESGEWIRIERIPEFGPRDESDDPYGWDELVRRADHDDEYELRIETGTRIFDTTALEVVEDSRESVWPELVASDPELANRISWILDRLGECGMPMIAFRLNLEKHVYAGPNPRSPGCKIAIYAIGFSEIDEPLDKDIEAHFGKWASFPDFPRLD